MDTYTIILWLTIIQYDSMRTGYLPYMRRIYFVHAHSQAYHEIAPKRMVLRRPLSLNARFSISLFYA